MVLRVVRVGEAVLLGASGALMYAASWQRWGGACPWGGRTSAACEIRQDNRYDFVAPSAPWVPVGSAAQLAGWSLLVLAVAYVLLPWVLTGRRPGPVVAVVLAGAVLGSGAAGLTTLRSGLVGRPVDPPAGVVPGLLWLFLPPVVLVSLAVSARGWGLVAAVSLFLATPIVWSFTYAIGSYDANPWWEAISAAFVALAGLCSLAAAFGSGRTATAGQRGGCAVDVDRGRASPGGSLTPRSARRDTGRTRARGRVPWRGTWSAATARPAPASSCAPATCPSTTGPPTTSAG